MCNLKISSAMASTSGINGLGQKQSQNPELKEIRKALFQSPGGVDDGSQEAIKALLNKLQIEHDVDVSLKIMQRDEHERRLSQLRKLHDKLDQDNWRYSTIDELIGLH